MGYLFILFSVLVLTAILFTVSTVFGYLRKASFRKAIAAGVILSVILGAFAGIGMAGTASEARDLAQAYEDLIVYQSTIENSTNEYVRYHYYEKICAYNEWFKGYQEESNSKWFGALYPSDWALNIDLIDFTLNGD